MAAAAIYPGVPAFSSRGRRLSRPKMEVGVHLIEGRWTLSSMGSSTPRGRDGIKAEVTFFAVRRVNPFHQKLGFF